MICRSRSLDARRRMDPAILLADPWESLDAGTEEADNPQGFLEATQDRSALHQALARLSASQRQLVGLAFIRGLTHSEISRQLKLPLGTVKSQMRQALGDLRRGLGGR
jgi:RNA polymerase sigma-70 factor (ECF subfamily)